MIFIRVIQNVQASGPKHPPTLVPHLHRKSELNSLCTQKISPTWLDMGRAGAFALLLMGGVLCREALSFVLSTGKGTRLPGARTCGRQTSAAIAARTRGRMIESLSMNLPDECSGVGPTREWHRVAHRNGERVRVGDRLPTAEVR